MRSRIDAAGRPADDGNAVPRQVRSYLFRHMLAVGTGSASAHHRQPGSFRSQSAPVEEDQRRLKDLPQQCRIGFILHGTYRNALRPTGGSDFFGKFRFLLPQRQKCLPGRVG